MHTSETRSSFVEVEPGYGGFICLNAEAGLHVDDIMFGTSQSATINSMIMNLQTRLRVMNHDEILTEIKHAREGQHPP